MSQMKRRLVYCAGAVVLLAGCAAENSSEQAATSPEQAAASPEPGAKPAVKYDTSRVAGNFHEIRLLPPGGPTPRTADGHPDLTGRYYPNQAGRMLQGGYQVDDSIYLEFDPAVPRPPQASPVLTPEGTAKYRFPRELYGECPVGGTPQSITMQTSQHGPMQLIQLPGSVWILTEWPTTIRYVPTDGRPHSEDPDPSFVGESVGRWEGDTLVVDTIAIDRRVTNPGGWHPSEKVHVVERFTRPSKNYIVYDLTIEDPVVLAQPYVHGSRRWSLAQDPDDRWDEYVCTHNEEPAFAEKLQLYGGGGGGDGRGGRGGQ
ncbi:MAG TPA: hypothetical protein VFD64_03420 [Gemmatimonadaceae bacterium]|nr:hypothetical protein [Gemmatimonadaceae bacterium]